MTPAEAAARYTNKANVVVAAWKALFGTVPTKRAVETAMAIAEFETRLGDAGGSWRGEHNWGAVHKRSLTQAEASILLGHGVYPSDEASLMTARGFLPRTGPNEALHIDHDPTTGAYFVWFWAFPDDVSAAQRYLKILVSQRPGVKAIIDTAPAQDVVRKMYESHYFTGFSTDPETNIAQYSHNVLAKEAMIAPALAAWDPSGAGAPLGDGQQKKNPNVLLIGLALLSVGAGTYYVLSQWQRLPNPLRVVYTTGIVRGAYELHNLLGV